MIARKAVEYKKEVVSPNLGDLVVEQFAIVGVEKRARAMNIGFTEGRA